MRRYGIMVSTVSSSRNSGFLTTGSRGSTSSSPSFSSIVALDISHLVAIAPLPSYFDSLPSLDPIAPSTLHFICAPSSHPPAFSNAPPAFARLSRLLDAPLPKCLPASVVASQEEGSKQSGSLGSRLVRERANGRGEACALPRLVRRLLRASWAGRR
ncbi:hypothetical protein BDZ90DRAFT_119954 [Jaminaea rosea]|uniref:Uncharacterized protein n=1 Tax=Jaminaea rosea TaxID=1569628 RepID=A0A316V0W6_9BASI|nr:hypothetical protein BDZ90DRAFT_119954 [Jaminaea rosea]PWN29813.1 hypothetical protein BDZ90DRAFT_119954 [Jaminaea rosea]